MILIVGALGVLTPTARTLLPVAAVAPPDPVPGHGDRLLRSSAPPRTTFDVGR